MHSRMSVYCPICRQEMNGINGYGRDADCCGKSCYDEWEWRKTLAIMGKPYTPQPKKVVAADSVIDESAASSAGTTP